MREITTDDFEIRQTPQGLTVRWAKAGAIKHFYGKDRYSKARAAKFVKFLIDLFADNDYRINDDGWIDKVIEKGSD